MSAGFNLCSEKNGDNEAYVEVILDIFEDSSVAIHSVEGEAVHEDPELCLMVNKALEKRPSSTSNTVGFALASFTKRLLGLTSPITKSQS
ncbi:hypothetical protein Pint_05550 [Pistacia integerrima]|uniref:Uncharacterized protein n=1 Tax=Pistacia integerrima TaxID=434235 RepID=A0ACC0Z3M7_9ROSI|nr:hypothetical protein Pint_05550 [Pistacia integerrima]